MKDTNDYSNLANLLSVHTEAAIRLAEIQSQADSTLMESLDELKPEHVQAQTALEESEAAIKLLAKSHPEWMDGRSIKTPYGTVRFTRSTKIEVANEEATITLIRATYLDGADVYLRVATELNLETLELLPEADLAKLGLSRVTTDSVSVKPAKVDMGKASKAKGPKAAGTEVAA